MFAAGFPSLQLCGSAVCFFSTAIHSPFPLPIYISFQPLASPEGIQALSGATSPNAQRLNCTVQILGFELNRAHCSLVFDYNGSGFLPIFTFVS